MALKKQKYAIIDIETTGGLAKRDKIIEIAIIITDGTSILQEFTSFINPQRSIPYEITRITGITDDMVEDAPLFYEVAKEIVLITEGAIFVAHNVNFDYNFIKYEFDRLGYTYTRKQLCTVKLSRKAFPGLKSYSLGNLIRHFDISVSARHRAYDDALATTKIFHMIANDQENENELYRMVNRGVKETKLPEAITIEKLHSYPESVGVYYFYDAYGTVIYVGKSINIKQRLMQHFAQITAKSEKMVRLTKDIGYIETGSELIAILLESEEIKKLNPQINKAQKTKEYPFYIYAQKDEAAYLNFGIKKITDKSSLSEKILSYYSSMLSAKSTLAGMRSLYELCESKLIIQGEKDKRCIYFEMGECHGACKEKESYADYNERAELAEIHLTKVFDHDFFIITQGRNQEEVGVIWIENKKYKGFGYISKDDADKGAEELMECVEIKHSTPESNVLIQLYLRSKSDYRLIKI